MVYNLLLYIPILMLTYILTKKILRKYQNLPPTPFPKLPIIGHLHLLKNPTQIHRTLASLTKKYGPVIHLQFGSRPVLVVSSASAAIDCLHHNDIAFTNRPQLTVGRVLGSRNGMIWAPYSSLWRNHRKISSIELLSSQRVHLLSDIRADEIKVCTQHMYDMCVQGKNVDVHRLVFDLGCNVLLRMIAGKRCFTYGKTETETGTGSDQGEIFRSVMKELVEIGPPITPVDFFPVLKYFGKSSGVKMYERLYKKIDGYFQGLVDEIKKEIQESESESGSGSKSKSFIEIFLRSYKCDPEYFIDDNIKSLVMDLFIGGSETQAGTMQWALSLLLNHPEILKKAQNEIYEHVGNNRLMEDTDINNLPFLRGIINETFRMCPPVAILPPHENSAECIVGGFQVKAGTMLLMNIWAIHNDPSVWDEPSKFKPERFETFENERLERVFMPFGLGRRSCPGQNLATRVVVLALGTFLQCFEWERIGDDLVDMEEIAGISMARANPLQAKCRPRDNMIHLFNQH